MPVAPLGVGDVAPDYTYAAAPSAVGAPAYAYNYSATVAAVAPDVVGADAYAYNYAAPLTAAAAGASVYAYNYAAPLAAAAPGRCFDSFGDIVPCSLYDYEVALDTRQKEDTEDMMEDGKKAINAVEIA